MTLIITIIAAVLCTLLWIFSPRLKKHGVSFPAIMFWSASLMWLVDGFFRISEGEAFLEISVDDTFLGFVIVASGLAAWGLIYFIGNTKNKATKN